MAKIGKNILDNLTTGMYSDSKVIFREYIQNACDQIDEAIKLGIISEEDGSVEIIIDSMKRYISIKDNATGVMENGFVENLGDIANSNKQIGQNKGFRGIGRLCGLAYCKTLKFKTSYAGERVASIMTCDAKKMRTMLIDNKKYTVDEIWDEIVDYKTISEDADKHYFEVELIDINQENTELLDEKKISDYLSFVAPVPYKNTFYLRSAIYDYSKNIAYNIDEYCIYVNGRQIFKEYSTKLKEKSGTNLKVYDEISKLEFKDFYDESGNLIAWMWYGLSRFEKSIPANNQMRGLRLRSGNIQIGDERALQELFKENRGNFYFVGEVFAANDGLIPNSQRDYFNENSMRVCFEDELRTYFYDVLHKLYYSANKIKNAYKKQEELVSVTDEFNKKAEESGFIDENEKIMLEQKVKKAEKEAEEAKKQIEKFKSSEANTPVSEVQKSIEKKYEEERKQKEAQRAQRQVTEKKEKKDKYITATMSKLSNKERKLISRVMSIINETAPKELAESIIEKIKEELK